MSDSDEPSWKRFENFDGGDGVERHLAMRDWHQRRIRSQGSSGVSGGGLSTGTPRKSKYGRSTHINGVLLK